MYILTALVAFAGSFVQSSSGFGYAIICMAIWPAFMPFYTASILEAIAAFFMVIYIAVKLWKSIDWKLLLPPIIMATITSLLGVNTLMSLDEAVLSKIMGTVLLVLAVYFIFFSSRVHLKASVISGIIAGAVSGFCGGLFNIGGPPMVAYFLSVTDDKEKYNATLQMFFTINTMSIFLIHVFQGHVTTSMIPLVGAALAGTAAGTVSGLFLFQKLTMDRIKKFVYIFMICAGGYLLLS
ncbi:sulfite exporter TauE/SafE family protein [Blautia sp. MSJ-19]|uniref:sulfite exporter TauE/SafE family protein n=1 Tax=Blautia sp. MSJ-19 TaxID=2841517 RepID=UPI001C0EE545|nr:sulfite exporter TauE/SafE family protein [Blautia sp. MSJ-19]MBU5479778.1 sulfite exporter TauE/SafE family protein [Blautia sp. MSJ-19]